MRKARPVMEKIVVSIGFFSYLSYGAQNWAKNNWLKKLPEPKILPFMMSFNMLYPLIIIKSSMKPFQ